MSEMQNQNENQFAETPRRRRSRMTREENTVQTAEGTVQTSEERPAASAAAAARTGSSAEQCMRYLTEIEGYLNRARRLPIGGTENYLVNRDAIINRITALRTGLPGAMQTAVQYVNSYRMIEAQQQQECETKRRTAEQQAAQMVNDATRRAEEMTNSARAQAEAMISEAQQRAAAEVEAARQEAMRIVDDAQHKADYLVSEEEIVRRAKVESNETRENTAQEVAALRKNTFDYLDSVMGELDRYTTQLLENMRGERTELNNHR